MSIKIYESDDVTLVSDLEFSSLEAGSDSTVLTLHAWNEGVQDAENILVLLAAENPSGSGDYVRAGVAPQDELWGRVRVVGHDNTADSTQEPYTTDWLPIGAYSGLLIPKIHAGCARYIEIKMRPPSGAQTIAWRWKIVGLDSEHSMALPDILSQVDRGILHGVGDFRRSGIIRGGAVNATGTPDDYVQIDPDIHLWQGAIKGNVSSSEQLDQNDSAAAALASGESYYAAITLGASGSTVTKGVKSATPAKPTPPAGELLQAWVTVDYQAGGTSVIELADIEDARVMDRYYCEAGDGLEAIVHAGFGLGGGTWRFSATKTSVALTASSTHYLYQLANGLWSAPTSETPPETTAIGPMWEVTTDGSGVTSIVDRRKLAGKTIVLRFAGATPGSAPNTVESRLCEYEELHVEESVFRCSDNGGGSSGSTVGEWTLNGTTAYTSKATDDQRPSIDYNATTLIDRDGVHEVCVIRKGDLVGFDIAQLPTGGSPADVELLLICRIP